MTTIEHRVEVASPIAVVWDVWSDVRRLPDYSKSTTEVRDAPERLTTIGQTFCQIARAAGKAASVQWVVVAIEPEDHLIIEGSPMRGVTVRITEAVENVHETRTKLTLTTDYRLPFGPLGRIVSKLGLDRLAEREAREVLDGVGRAAEAAYRSRGEAPSERSR